MEKASEGLSIVGSDLLDILDRMTVHQRTLDFIADLTKDERVEAVVVTLQEAFQKTINDLCGIAKVQTSPLFQDVPFD